jgi:hypothetical protein
MMEEINQPITYCHVKKGRRITKNIKEDKEYYKKFYHLKKEVVECECGRILNNWGLLKHRKTDYHKRVMEKIELVKELNSLKI